LTQNTKCGFVAVVGRPNVGKSTLLNALIGERIALVSHKANATRKRLNGIAMHGDAQIIFVDTPGMQNRQKELNVYMMKEAVRAIGDADMTLFLTDSRAGLGDYEDFLALAEGKPHIVVINKQDLLDKHSLTARLSEYAQYTDKFLEIVPICATKKHNTKELLSAIAKHLPESPFLYDPEDLTDQKTRDIYKEIIREELFNGLSDELPYEAEVVMDKVEDGDRLDKIKATIVVNRESQKGMIIGQGGATLKRIGTKARLALEAFSGKKIFLELFVRVEKGWVSDRSKLKNLGYDDDER
jgi:GTPase